MDPEHGVPPQDPQEQENILQGMINENNPYDPNNDDITRTFLNESGEGDESLNQGDAHTYNGEGDEGEGDGSGGTLKLGEVYTYVVL